MAVEEEESSGTRCVAVSGCNWMVAVAPVSYYLLLHLCLVKVSLSLSLSLMGTSDFDKAQDGRPIATNNISWHILCRMQQNNNKNRTEQMSLPIHSRQTLPTSLSQTLA